MNLQQIQARLLAALSLFLLLGAVTRAGAAPAPVSGVAFGSVDIQKIITKYNKTAAMNAQIDLLRSQFGEVIKTQAANPMLSAVDQQQLSDLLLKTTLTDADKQTISALEAKSQKDSQDLATLQQKKDLTDPDRIRLQQLTDEQKTGAQALDEQNQRYTQSIQDKNTELGQQVADDIRAAVATVAQQKGLSAVFDSQFAIYTANDVTQAVIAKLNATK